VTSFTTVAANKVAVGFDILPPVWGSPDNRTAGTLAVILYNDHNNRSSLLYTVLPNTNPDPASFSSNYENIPVWGDAPTPATVVFPWQYIVIIVAAILAAILLCCLIYCCYHHTRGANEKPRNVSRMRGVEIGGPTNNVTKSQRFYNDDENKHTNNSDHINFVRSPTRGNNDLTTARRIGSSPDTRSDPVSYQGATLNSADDKEAPHLDPREWKSVVALHGRGGTVDQGDLPFKIGDTIRVVGPCDGPHWFEGEVNGQRGMVPVNHVKGQTRNDEVRLHQRT